MDVKGKGEEENERVRLGEEKEGGNEREKHEQKREMDKKKYEEK